MKKALAYLLSVMLVLALGMWGGGAFAADSGGYGGGSSTQSDSGGYGGGSSSASSGGYGSSTQSDSGGYGGGSSSASSGGYGSSTQSDSGGYGGGSTAEVSGGYGSSSAAKPAAAAKKTAAEPAAKMEAPAAPETGEAGMATAPATEEAMAPNEEPAPVSRPRGPQPVTLLYILSGLAVGFAMGWVLQRGRFCMNTAFRDIIFIKDHTFSRAWILALLVAMVGANLLNDMGVIAIARQPFWWIADILGGYVFGLGIVLAGGCGSGIWYRVGEGLVAAWVAVLGFFLGIAAMSWGVFRPLFLWLRQITIEIGGQSAPGLYHIVGDGAAFKWGVIAVICIVGGVYIMKGKPFEYKKAKGYFWSLTGLLIGLVAIAAFYASYTFGGFTSGVTFTTPTRDLFLTIVTGGPQPTGPGNPLIVFRMGSFLVNWPIFFIIGVPLGSYVSAKLLGEFKLKTPPAGELVTVFGGSLMMGVGAMLCGGCNMGQGVTGVVSLSIGSIVATISIILGNWTMVYFKFIKPMQDMDV